MRNPKHLFEMILLLLFISIPTFAQRVSVDYRQRPLDQVFTDLKNKTGYEFIYQKKILVGEKPVTLNMRDASFNEVLDRIFMNRELGYDITKRTVVIHKAEKARQSFKKTITGEIVDENGDPLPGASIRIKGTKEGAISNGNGQFTIEVDGSNPVLLISYVGMNDKEVLVTSKTARSMKIEMTGNTNLMQEVVVTGYGNMLKSAYTGAASVLNTDKQKDLPVISITQMMESNIPGVTIFANNGTPGAQTSISIRGFGSLSASNEPLYVLDGIPIQSGNMSANDMNTAGLGILNTLNPADIENITVLKDAASASLYGARGANGIILITTKKGKQGKTSYNFKASYGVTDFAYDFRPTMGGEERRNLILEGLRNANLDAGDTPEWAEEHAEEEIDKYAVRPTNGYSDWEKALFHKASIQNYDFSLMGGNDNTRFAGSISYTNQDNIARNSGFERYSGHANFSNKYKRFDVSMNAIFSLTKEKPVPGAYYYSNPLYALKTVLTPSMPIFNNDGSYNRDFPSIGYMNLVQENELNTHKAQIARTFGAVEAGYTILEGLRLSTLMNVDYTFTKDFRYFSPLSADGSSPNGQGDMTNIENLTFNSNTRLNYIKKIGEHTIDLLASYEIQKWNKELLSGEAKNYSTTKKDVLNNASTPVSIGNYRSGDSMLSYVLRMNYNYMEKYYLSLSYRRDGSSRLDPSNRWDDFWAASCSWRISQEKFLANCSSWLNDAKLRVSYGVNGNIPSGLYSYYGLYDLSGNYNNSPAMIESNLANHRLSWEKNYALNIGFDLLLFNRLNISFDWYKRRTSGLLLDKIVNPITGFSDITDNIGKMQNKGFEIEITSRNIDSRNFTWTTSLNISHNKNKVIKLSDVPQYYTGNYYIVKEGYSLGTIALREYAGVDSDNGKPMYYSNIPDENGVRSREKVDDPNNAVSIPLSNIYPKVSGGLSNTFRYKFIDASANLSYSLGGHSYDAGMWAIQDDGYSSMSPKSTELRRRWQKKGDITDVPRYVAGQQYGGYWHSSRGIHSTDHLRLKSLVLGVKAPENWLKPLGLSLARVYFSGTNLLTLARYNQYDPELVGTVGFDIPPIKTLSFGLEIGF